MSISPDFSPVLVFTKKYFMKNFGAFALDTRSFSGMSVSSLTRSSAS